MDESQEAAAALKQQQMDAMAAQQRADLAAGARRQAEIEAAYQMQQPNYDAAFADMERQQGAGQQNPAAVASNTRSQVAGYLADQANRRGISPQWWLADPAAADVVPSGSQTPTGTPQGLTGRPSRSPPPQSPTPALQRPVATPAGVPDALATDPSGLPPDALAQARRLPAWVYGIGTALENALQVSGQARPVAMYPEVMNAVGRLQAKGMLPGDIATALRGHDGRVVPLLYGLIRNEALLHNGIDRTVGGAWQGVAALAAA